MNYDYGGLECVLFGVTSAGDYCGGGWGGFDRNSLFNGVFCSLGVGGTEFFLTNLVTLSFDWLDYGTGRILGSGVENVFGISFSSSWIISFSFSCSFISWAVTLWLGLKLLRNRIFSRFPLPFVKT